MPFIRQTRDKRGFEHTYVMHQYHQTGGGATRPRVLYLFRSPASLRIGRKALDAEVMEALEHTHPDLSFDWAALSRDPASSRVELPGERPRRQSGRGDRQSASGSRSGGSASADESLLGRTIGASEAARLRRSYAELVQRIARRARTPEDRDRLIERAARLNPDEWPDEASVRASAAGADAALEAIGAELPSRRRGRRGGRRRPGIEDGGQPSGIMAGETPALDEAVHEGSEDPRSGGSADARGDSGAVGAAAPDSDAADASDADTDLPVGD